MANRQMEIPVHNNGVVTSRSLNQNSSENSNIFLPEQEKQLAELKKRLVELKIRFDTNPNYYQKNDYKELINLIASSLIYLYSDASHAEIITSWEQVVADDTIPSSKLVNDTFELVDMTINSHYSALVEMLLTLSGVVAKEETLTLGISDIRSDISNIDIDTSTLAKEDTLTTGISNIRSDISNISIDTSNLALEATSQTISGKLGTFQNQDTVSSKLDTIDSGINIAFSMFDDDIALLLQAIIGEDDSSSDEESEE